MKTKVCLTACAAVFGLAVLSASANLVVNGDFESSVVDTAFGDGPGAGQWNDNTRWVGGAGADIGSYTRSGIGDNTTQVCELTQVDGVMYQNTGNALNDGVGLLNTTFNWSFKYYIPSTTTDGGIDYSFYASDDGNTGGHGGAFGSINFNTAAPDTWQTISGQFSIGTYTAGGNGDYRMKFDLNHSSSTTGSIYIDDLNVTAVPEPATIGLIGLASLGLVATRRLRRM